MIVHIGDKAFDAAMVTRPKDSKWNNRESKALTLEMSYAEAIETFVNDLEWSVETVSVDDNGVETTNTIDMKEYSLAGTVTDNRDGTITVKMGKYLPDELMLIPLAESPKDRNQAEIWRAAIETAMQGIEDDQVALAAAPLYPMWADLLGNSVDTGFRFRHEDSLYKTRKAHTLSAEWVPGEGTESLYERIDEQHAGTMDDPIPYEGNMELKSGLYYTQDGVIYLCNRDSDTAVYHALKDLIGLYVEVVE